MRRHPLPRPAQGQGRRAALPARACCHPVRVFWAPEPSCAPGALMIRAPHVGSIAVQPLTQFMQNLANGN